jgi:dolichol-phosphate mannosyltransferase
MRVLVVVPTYNERENVEGLCRRILEVEGRADVLVIDDGSPDGTGDVAEKLAAETGRVRVMHRAGKLGLGTAHVAGLRYGLEGGYDRVVTMDADFSHPPEKIPELVDLCEECDVAVGSRYVPGGGVRNWPPSRIILSAGANWLTRTVLHLSARDCTGAFRCFRADVLARLELERLRSVGYSIQEEMMWLCERSGCRIGEVPFVFVDRARGSSKVSLGEITGVLKTLGRLLLAPRPRRIRP